MKDPELAPQCEDCEAVMEPEWDFDCGIKSWNWVCPDCVYEHSADAEKQNETK